MTNTVKNSIVPNIGTTLTTVYTAPASTSSTVIGFTLANITSTAITCDVTVTDVSLGVTGYIGRYIPLASGSTAVIGGYEQKLVLETGDYVSVVSSANTSVDSVISVLEVS